MIRAVVLAAAATAAIASGCATFDDDAAAVNGVAISQESFDRLLTDVTDLGLAGIVVDPATGTVEAAGARQVLDLMINVEATSQFLDQAGESITDADRAAYSDTVDPAQLDEVGERTRALLIENGAAPIAAARVPAPAAEELQRRYEQDPVSAGVMCVRHILVETEAEAQEIVDELELGEDFAALATARSLDEGSAVNGGALGVDDQACIGLPAARQSLDPGFFAGAAAAHPGIPTEPVASQFGWHVILARPYDEVADSIAALHAEEAGALGLAAFLATADVAVDPRYGAWDTAATAVVGLG